MPSMKITVVRESVMEIDVPSKEAAEHLARQLRLDPRLHPICELLGTYKVEVTDNGEKPGRWSMLNGKLEPKPLRVPNRNALELLAGDWNNDIALVVDKAGTPKEGFIFARDVKVEPKKNLVGVFEPHLVIESEVVCPFDKKHMVACKTGVWITEPMMKHIVQLLQQKNPS